MNFDIEETKNTKKITVTVLDYYNPSGRALYTCGQLEEILRDKYNLNNYELTESTADMISNFQNPNVGVYTFSKKSAAVSPPQKDEDTSETNPAENKKTIKKPRKKSHK